MRFFGNFYISNAKMVNERTKMYTRMKWTNQMLQTPLDDWKPLIDGGKMIFRVCRYENVDKKMRK